jgi:hypothetical protein
MAVEPYIIEPAYTKIEVLQPRFEIVTERIETKPASTKWVKKQADASCLSANPDDCLVWCLVELPAEYKTLTRRVNKGCDDSGKPDAGCVRKVEVPAQMGSQNVLKVKAAATFREEIIPAEYKAFSVREVKNPATTREEVIPAENIPTKKQILKTPAIIQEEDVPAEQVAVTKEVVKVPATTREEIIPSETQTVTVRTVKTPATVYSEDIQAETAGITKLKVVKPGGFSEWREVLCGEKVTGYTIRQIQVALNKAGYNVGTPNNEMGSETKEALTKFQKDHKLPVGNLDMETLKALGVH